MNLSVSTRVEQAWYMDPELLAAEEDAERPKKVEIDADVPPPKDATVILGEGDLEELSEALAAAADGDEEARHYRDVSLRGAIMAADDTMPTVSLGGRFRGLVDDGIALLEKANAHLPKDEISSRATRARVRAVAMARAAFDMLQPGRVAPPRLAAAAFLAGVGMTLVGVLIAL